MSSRSLLIPIALLSMYCVTGHASKAVAADAIARPEWPLIEAVRRSPWDEKAVLELIKWYEQRDPPRSELMKLQMQLSQMSFQEPEYATLRIKEEEMIDRHRERWTEPLKEFGLRKKELKIRLGLIDEVRCEGITDAHVEKLMQVPEIRVLHVRTPFFLTVKGFSQLVKLPQLDELTIGDMTLAPFHWQTLETLPPWTVVRVYGRGQDRKAQAEMNEKRSAKFDALSPEEQYRAGVRFASTFDSGIRFGSRMKKARLSQASVTDIEMKLLSPLTDLTDVYISESHITSKGLSHLAGMKDLRHLDLWRTRVETIEPLADLEKLTTFSFFPEFGTKVSDGGLTALENFTQLKSVRIWYADIGEGTFRALGKLKKLESLELNLRELEETKSLSHLSNLTELRELTLTFDLPESALEYLSEMSHLERLTIRLTNGTGEGLKYLSGLNQLTTLKIGGQGTTDAGLKHLSNLTRLRTLSVWGPGMTLEGAQKLATKLPRVTIHVEEGMVKAPRDKYILTRQRLRSASILLPQDWKKSPYDRSLDAEEDGFDGIRGAAEIELDLESNYRSPEELIDALHKSGIEPAPQTLERDLIKLLDQRKVKSCIYESTGLRCLLVAFESPDGLMTLTCQVPRKRFREFQTLFEAVARSIHVDPKPEAHADETRELPVKQP